MNMIFICISKNINYFACNILKPRHFWTLIVPNNLMRKSQRLFLHSVDRNHMFNGRVFFLPTIDMIFRVTCDRDATQAEPLKN